jgi:hypothetical protein
MAPHISGVVDLTAAETASAAMRTSPSADNLIGPP